MRYVSFAILATLANLSIQRLVLLTGSEYGHFIVAVAAGTFVGLVIKYLLDKHWIFFDTTNSLRRHGQKFILYTLVGLGTTIVFWGFETIFWIVWQTELMREIGAVIGLTLGYILKYQLDRRFVFTDSQLRQSR